MADWMTGVMLGDMIGLEYFVGIYDAEYSSPAKMGASIVDVSMESSSAGTVERISTSVTPASTGVTIIPRSGSGSGAGGGGCYPV